MIAWSLLRNSRTDSASNSAVARELVGSLPGLGSASVPCPIDGKVVDVAAVDGLAWSGSGSGSLAAGKRFCDTDVNCEGTRSSPVAGGVTSGALVVDILGEASPTAGTAVDDVRAGSPTAFALVVDVRGDSAASNLGAVVVEVRGDSAAAGA